MFQTNRFTGIDRIGDANQLTFALTSRFLNDDTGAERLRASVGGIYLFQQHKVFCNDDISCSPDPTVNETISPLVGELSYTLTPRWNVVGDLAWDPNRTQVNDGSINVIYNNDKKVVNLGYYFVSGADMPAQASGPVIFNPVTQTTGPVIFNPQNTVDLSRVNMGFSWPVTERWSAIADWNYNLSQGYAQVYFYGLQYDSCCFAARLVNSHTLMAIDQTGNTHFDNEFFVQIQLKGLGNFGYNNPSSLLSSALPGYQDQFLGTLRPLS
jgi:LPS-assembly protein